MLKPTVHTGNVEVEGDTLYYEVRGQGTPLLMISAAAGNGDFYSRVADILAAEYQVITYDRRANGRSTRNSLQNFEMSQQSRDAVAVIKAVGHSKAAIFGNSGGAAIALDVVKHFPEVVHGAVIHEPPLVKIHPNKQELLSFFGDIYRQAVTVGTEAAMNTFASKLFSLDMRALPWAEIITMPFEAFGLQVQTSNDFFLKNEILPFTNYEPDIAALKRHASRIMLAAGEQSLAEKRFYAETAPSLAKTIAAEFVFLPGHHMSFLDHPKEWAVGLREALKKV